MFVMFPPSFDLHPGLPSIAVGLVPLLSSDDHCLGARSLQSGSDFSVESVARLDTGGMGRLSGVVIHESAATS